MEVVADATVGLVAICVMVLLVRGLLSRTPRRGTPLACSWGSHRYLEGACVNCGRERS